MIGLIEYLNKGGYQKGKSLSSWPCIAKTSVNNNNKWGGAVQLKTMCTKHITIIKI